MRRIGLFVAVSAEHITRGVNAKDCCDHVIAKAGNGRGGGKADSSNAHFPVGDNTVESLLAIASGYFSGLL